MNNHFEYVYSLEASQHFTSFKLFCQESFRVLKHNGKLVVSTYFLNDKFFVKNLEKIIPNNLEGFHNALPVSDAIEDMTSNGFDVQITTIAIGQYVFPLYACWQKMRLGSVSPMQLSNERKKWQGYYTGGGRTSHPWYQAFKKRWVDYYILEGIKKKESDE